MSVCGRSLQLLDDFCTDPFLDYGPQQDDLWAGPGPGYTCCQAEDLTNPVSQLYERIDIVFTRNIALAAGRSILIGDSPAERTPSGLWPSDHAGVVTRLEPFATHLPTLISPPPVEGGGNKSTS